MLWRNFNNFQQTDNFNRQSLQRTEFYKAPVKNVVLILHFLWHSIWQHQLHHSLASIPCANFGEICQHAYFMWYFLFLYSFQYSIRSDCYNFFWENVMCKQTCWDGIQQFSTDSSTDGQLQQTDNFNRRNFTRHLWKMSFLSLTFWDIRYDNTSCHIV